MQRSEVQHYDEESFLGIAPGIEGQGCINVWCQQWSPAGNDNFRWRMVKVVEPKKPLGCSSDGGPVFIAVGLFTGTAIKSRCCIGIATDFASGSSVSRRRNLPGQALLMAPRKRSACSNSNGCSKASIYGETSRIKHCSLLLFYRRIW